MSAPKKKKPYVPTGRRRGRVSKDDPDFVPTSKLERARKEAQVEQLLIRRIPESQIVRLLAVEWKHSERSIWQYIKRVRDRWMNESLGTRDEQRVHMRKTLNDLYSKSINLSEVVRGPDGRPLLDAKGKTIVVENPDLHAAARTAKLLIEFDGLGESKKVDVSIPNVAPITVTADVTHADRGELESFLKRKAAGRKATQEGGKA